MKIFLVLLLVSLNLKAEVIDLGMIYSANPVAFGGESSGGGGSAVVCYDHLNKVKSVEMLDTYEARILQGLIFPDADTRDYMIQVYDYLDRLKFDQSFYLDMKEAIEQINEDIVFLPEGVDIHTPSDLGQDETVIKPSGCEILGVGYYEKNGILRISNLFSKMTEFQKAAFIIHEAVYSLYRHYYNAKLVDQFKTSAKSSRTFTAYLLANSSEVSDREHYKEMRWPKEEYFYFTSPLILTNSDHYKFEIKVKEDSEVFKKLVIDFECINSAQYYVVDNYNTVNKKVIQVEINSSNKTFYLELNNSCRAIMIRQNKLDSKVSKAFLNFIDLKITNQKGDVIKVMTDIDYGLQYRNSQFQVIYQPTYYLN